MHVKPFVNRIQPECRHNVETDDISVLIDIEWAPSNQLKLGSVVGPCKGYMGCAIEEAFGRNRLLGG